MTDSVDIVENLMNKVIAITVMDQKSVDIYKSVVDCAEVEED